MKCWNKPFARKEVTMKKIILAESVANYLKCDDGQLRDGKGNRYNEC